MELFAVVGKPVLHSMSPQMHNAAFSELGIDAGYVRLAAESAEGAIKTAKEAGIAGMNVTSPFKEEFFDMVDVKDGNAQRLRAVNTLVFRDGKTYGYNTDPDGAAGALSGNDIEGGKALVIGAGGAARAAVVALQELGADVTLLNRTHEKALRVSESLGCKCLPVDSLEDALEGTNVIVSAVSTSEEVIPGVLLKKDMTVLDANYSLESALVRDAKAAGCRVVHGKEWLIHQGVRAFEIFTGKKVDADIMRSAISKKSKVNIALIGFMGCGKNTVAEELSRLSGMEILDTDSEIEKRAGKSISEIFKDGEGEFRSLESEEAAKIPADANKIVNCGGGLVLRNGPHLKESVVVWLWASKELLKKRIPKDGSRPLLNCPNPEERIDELLSSRIGSYARASDIMIDTDENPQKVAERILYEVRQTFPNIRSG